MGQFILLFTAVFQLVVFTVSLYYLIISFFGLYKSKSNIIYSNPKNKFAVIIAAHNEEMVIEHIVECLKGIDYPHKLYDIFVIADNCMDKTAEVAREHGAIVYERADADKRGKGYALEWMFNQIYEMENKYDALIIFDADNLASRNFLREMDQKLKEGYKVIQGYLDSKNPHDSWVTEAYSIAFWTANRLFQLGRSNLGLSNQIGGTGFCVELNTLKKIGWGATCLTEDLEFTCKLILSGFKVGWTHDAIVYDEKPLTLAQSWKQRKRWMQGFADVSSRFLVKLLKKAWNDKDLVAFDCALYTLQPFVIVLIGISGLLTFLQNSSRDGLYIFTINYLFSPIVWRVFSIFQFLFTPFVMIIEKKLSRKMFAFLGLYSFNIFLGDFKNRFDLTYFSVICIHIGYILLFISVISYIEGRNMVRLFIRYLLYGFYILTWIPITIQGIMNKDNKEWSHTKHTRQISINEIEGMDGQSAA